VFLHCPNNHFENIFIFLIAPLKLGRQKKLEGAFPCDAPPPPQVMPMAQEIRTIERYIGWSLL